MDKLLQCGVIGAGVFGTFHTRKYQGRDRAALVGVYDADIDRARTAVSEADGARAFDDLSALLEVCDAVTIASPATLHGEQALAALKAGCHVLVEKPLAISAEAADRCVREAEARQLVLQVGHQERFVFDAMGVFDVQEIPERIYARRFGPFSDRGADVSVTMDLMIHDLDLALRLADCPAVSIAGETRSERTDNADYSHAEIVFENGMVAELEASRLAEDRDRVMRIEYPSGVLNVDFVAKTFDNGTPFDLNADFASDPKAADSLGANVSAFIDSILDGAPVAIPGRQALDAVRLAEIIDADKTALSED
ncbi:Gfo/Idh/MocA family protein [Euryhalocaulis caribicus]|uniref:Gfo/Idh/MocA family protein n=1 Tax=Euryhalocaulis caribicus TaxID=1161401 RepID=UPI00039A0296|nr:Gfo/Idh/MocA family oxidoreductase [Euryhalocaulis caribicus]